MQKHTVFFPDNPKFFHFIENDQAKLRQHYLSTPKHDELRGSITPIQKCNENQGEWMSQ